MLDALEAAEAAFEQQEAAAEQQRQIDRIASIKGGAGPGASAAAAAAAAAAAMAVPPPDTPRKAAIAPISEASRGEGMGSSWQERQAPMLSRYWQLSSVLGLLGGMGAPSLSASHKAPLPADSPAFNLPTCSC